MARVSPVFARSLSQKCHRERSAAICPAFPKTSLRAKRGNLSLFIRPQATKQSCDIAEDGRIAAAAAAASQRRTRENGAQ